MKRLQSKADGFFYNAGRKKRERRSNAECVAFARGGEATQAAITYTTTAATKAKQAVRNWILEMRGLDSF